MTIIDQFWNQFPQNATSWAQATDEPRDLCRDLREYYNEFIGELEACNFRAFTSPAEWNTKSREWFYRVFNSMRVEDQQRFIDYSIYL